MSAQIAIAPMVTATMPRHRRIRVELQRVGQEVAGERAEHVHVAVREIDQPQHAVDHRVAERDERVDRAERETVDELLEERVHKEGTEPFSTESAQKGTELSRELCPLSAESVEKGSGP